MFSVLVIVNGMVNTIARAMSLRWTFLLIFLFSQKLSWNLLRNILTEPKIQKSSQGPLSLVVPDQVHGRGDEGFPKVADKLSQDEDF